MLASILNATLRLLLLQSGPQDFPFVPGTTRLLLPLAVLANFLLFQSVLPALMALAMALAMVAVLHLATRTLLRLRKLDGRFTQTFDSLLATGGLLALLSLLPMSQIAPTLAELVENPERLQAGTPIELPALPSLLMNLLNLWSLLVTAHIYRHAAGFGLAASILTALLVALVTLLFVMFSGAFAAALFDLMPAAA